MNDSTHTPMERLPSAPPAPLPPNEHAARVAFLGGGDDQPLRRVGFNPRNGLYSNVWHRTNMPAFPEGHDDDEDVAVLRNLHQRARGEHRAMADTLVGLYADGDLDNDDRLTLAAKVIGPKLDALAVAADGQLGKVDARIKQEQTELAEALRVKDPAAAVVQTSIRDYWREQGGGKLATAIAKGVIDTDALQAITSVPAYMSGVTGDTYAAARELLAKRLAPERVQAITALTVGKHRALQALQALHDAASHLIDRDKAKAIEARQREALARHGVEG